jgi:hypothetical protein
MAVIQDWIVEVDVDQVLRSQGGDPQAVRLRRPELMNVAARAIAEGMPLIEPSASYQVYKIRQVQHERLLLSSGDKLIGKSLSAWLAPARELIVIACTIGGNLERYIQAIMPADPVFGLALDGVGSAAIQNLSTQVCSYFRQQASVRGWEVTLPFSPGMEGWPAEVGQHQLFRLLDQEETAVRLTESGFMLPGKSLSMIIGLGPEVDSSGRICDYCASRYSCRHQDQYV